MGPTLKHSRAALYARADEASTAQADRHLHSSVLAEKMRQSAHRFGGPVTQIEPSEVVNVIYDLHVNPLAQIVTQLLATLVQKGALTKNEARFLIAGSVKVISASNQPADLKKMAAREIQRMLEALNTLPD